MPDAVSLEDRFEMSIETSTTPAEEATDAPLMQRGSKRKKNTEEDGKVLTERSHYRHLEFFMVDRRIEIRNSSSYDTWNKHILFRWTTYLITPAIIPFPTAELLHRRARWKQSAALWSLPHRAPRF